MLSIIKQFITKENIRKGIDFLREKGFFAVFGGSVLIKCISFCSVLLLPRILDSTSQYGILSIVDNVNSYLILVNGLGLSNSILRFCVLKETYDQKRAVFDFCLQWGMVINGVILIIALIVVSFMDLSISGLRSYLLMGLGVPAVMYVFDCSSLFLRADMKNKEYAKLSVIYTALYAGLQILLTWGFSVYGALAGRYLSLIIVVAIGMLFIKKRTELFDFKRIALSMADKKEIFSFAIGGLIANSFSIIMPMNEQMVVTVLLSDETQTAFYKAASLIPTNLQFIANAIVIFVYPYFTKHSEDFKWVKSKAKLTLLALACIIVPIALVLASMSPVLINVIFGRDYLPAMGLMRMMWIAFSINSILRMPLGSILGAIGKVKFNAFNAGITAACHLVMDYIFISAYGISGAAMALTIAYLGSGIVDVIYIYILSKKHMEITL